MDKCSSCKFGMESKLPTEKYCILNPPTPVALNGQIIMQFPMMLSHGKCGQYVKGKNQKENKPSALKSKKKRGY